ncbi:Hpt domain-containing protein [bacterium]|nr:Hpt domain-containing protein [bacterium]
MLTTTKLKENGVDTAEALARFMNNEALYLRLFEKAIKETNLDKLEDAIKENNLDDAFEISHSMKGVFGNLSITNLYKISSNLTELLRAKKDIDYNEYLKELSNELNKYLELIN